MRRLLSTSFLFTALVASALAADAAGDAPKPKPYTLDTCIVSGDKLGGMGDPVVIVRAGREIKLCCKGCIKDFDKDPAAFVKKIEAAVVWPTLAPLAEAKDFIGSVDKEGRVYEIFKETMDLNLEFGSSDVKLLPEDHIDRSIINQIK